MRPCRTPPGVRELKLMGKTTIKHGQSRTPPGVRELKLQITNLREYQLTVAPLPGCVN